MLGLTLLVILLGVFRGTLRLVTDGLVLLAWAIVALAFFCWYSLRLRFVRVDEESLYVAKWFREIRSMLLKYFVRSAWMLNRATAAVGNR
jgi:hypothetical protein